MLRVELMPAIAENPRASVRAITDPIKLRHHISVMGRVKWFLCHKQLFETRRRAGDAEDLTIHLCGYLAAKRHKKHKIISRTHNEPFRDFSARYS